MRSPFPRLFAVLVFLLIGALSACQTTPSQTSVPSDQAYAPLNLHLHADRYEFTTPQSMCAAILTAEVKNITHGKSHWNTPDGLRPHIAAAAPHMSLPETIVAQGYRIYTPVRFGTMKVLRDLRQQPTQEFVTVGGQVQQDQLWLDPFPQLQDTGHYVIVFGPGIQPAGKGKVGTWLEVYDAFPVDEHGIVTLQQAGSPNEPGPGQPQPAVKISLTDLQHQLAACK
ncbi:hypothetical protein A4R35_09335 [Thermogemmatispora tikiterensis]|uniref:Spondin domain-containing protein n=2 Tax=Thermogemmatispora tikiterensis TaxID=1825093 RepID=A0A328VDG8_9CHLR|nr:hypothetical protein A4R35_09335 [Thermogemmatispora tikiterensis]